MYVYNRAAAIPPRASRHLSLWGFSHNTSFSLFFSPSTLCYSSWGNMKGDDGIMLVSTVSLANLMRKGDMTSEDLLKTYRHNEGNIYPVIPRDSLIEVKWADLPTTPYAVMSYQWQSKWESIAELIALRKRRVLKELAFYVMESIPRWVPTLIAIDRTWRHMECWADPPTSPLWSSLGGSPRRCCPLSSNRSQEYPRCS